MFNAIVRLIGSAVVGVLAILGVRWKIRADLAKRQIEDYQLSSDRYQTDAKRRVDEVKRQAAGQAPIDLKSRKDFE